MARRRGASGSRGCRGRGNKKTHESCSGDQTLQSNMSQPASDASQGVEGSNVLEQESGNPIRKEIDVNSAAEFTDHSSVIRKMTSILKSMFGGPWTTWKEVGSTGREALWQHFKGLYQWPPSSDSLVRTTWENGYKKRFSSIMQGAREESLHRALDANVNASLQGNLSLLKPFNPKWIKKKDWKYMINKVWNKPKWKRKSQTAKQNRNKMEDGSISKHCGGSISIPQHKARLEAKLKRPLTALELYAKLHTNKSTQEYITPKTAKTADAYQKAILVKYGDDPNCHPLWDAELWGDASGGVKKGRISGWGSVSDPHRLLVGSSLTPNMEVIYERVREEMREEMVAQREELDAKAAEIEAKRQEMREEMDAKAEEIEATRQDITAKQKHIDARYEEMEKMVTALQDRKGGN